MGSGLRRLTGLRFVARLVGAFVAFLAGFAEGFAGVGLTPRLSPVSRRP